MSILYNLGIELYGTAVQMASAFNPKAKQWIEGRNGWHEKLKSAIDLKSPYIWFHCASLGEFEQGRPLIETLKKKHPKYKILLTFFSPSGYEIRKGYSNADYVCYLPLDTPFNARDFISIVQPQFAVFVKYEFWFNYIKELKRKNIPLFIVSAIFRDSQIFFKPYGFSFRKTLRNIDHFFVQNQKSALLLEKIGIKQYTLTGDTRFDRVLEIAESFKPLQSIEDFIDNDKAIVAGSTWEEDEHLLAELMGDMPMKLIIAPHEISEDRLKFIENLFLPHEPIRLSQFVKSTETIEKARVLIIDNIGLLSKLYYYGFCCYIGGGFGNGIHNTLEAAVYGKPLFFGPNCKKFKEANDLIVLNAAFVCTDKEMIQHMLIQFLSDEAYYDQISFIASNYVKTNAGATQDIMNYLEEKKLV